MTVFAAASNIGVLVDPGISAVPSVGYTSSIAGTSGTPGTPVAGVPVTGTPDAVDQEARKTFGDMDENKDGAIDEADWGRSRRIRPWFEGVGIKVNLPMNIETFVGNYRRAKEGQSR